MRNTDLQAGWTGKSTAAKQRGPFTRRYVVAE